MTNKTSIVENLSKIIIKYDGSRVGQLLQSALDDYYNKKNVDFHDISDKEFNSALSYYSGLLDTRIKTKKGRVVKVKREVIKNGNKNK